MGKSYERDCKGGEDCTDEAHLCKIAKRGDLERIRELVRGARFFCRKCGRATRDPQNLCKPIDIG